MRQLVPSLAGALILSSVVVAIGGAALLFAEPFYQRIVFGFLVNLIVVVGLQVFMGNSDITSYGHISFMAIAAYLVAILATPVAIKRTALATAPFGLSELQLGIVPSVLIAILITVFIAAVVGTMLVRQTGVPASIATLAFLVIVHVVIVNWVDLTRGPRAIYGVPVKANLVWATACAVFAIVVARLFRDSRWGLQLRAASQNIAAAGAMGVRIKRLRLAAWILSAAFLATAGVLFTLFVGTISPNSFYYDLTFLTLAMLILGGSSVSGAVAGAVVVTFGVEVMRFLENGPVLAGVKLPEMFGLTGLFLGAIIVLCMALRPGGLIGADEIDEIWRQRSRARATEVDSALSTLRERAAAKG
ncbi:branched-chain amino acid ABC transporter permease [Mesorhizobium sp. CO1-1-8]|uniref:branched-chain amino acid ABC transporter permease n=1 Tax=Mesorhizobium sp. CO1-1-8 TaxID=2876631 RepID=UPI001CD0B04C|nr:branched-chain amino acid ABC transporter permease [Mesorhizobium sp. CO1-1-8]MBZ9772476.1 branched-chain amino acid ABC transporter permease [Mesorhizobium sp. CO1-1-8]